MNTDAFLESARIIALTAEQSASDIAHAAQICIDAVRSGGKILICGNGGSAAEAQHMAAELVVRLRGDNNRPAIPAICLNADTAILTACANDYGYEEVFARQVEALAREGDALVCLSTSGKSANIWRAYSDALCHCAAFVFIGGAHLASPDLAWDWQGEARAVIAIPSTDTARIQEATLVVIHELCRMIEEGLHGEG